MRKSLYSGWTILAIAALAMVATLPGRTQGLGLITEPLLADLKIDRVDYANLNLWATLIGAVFSIPFGRLADRFGSQIILTGIVLALGISVILMSWSTGPIVLFVTITLTRGFGQSALSVVSLSLVGKWFSRRLNFAMGIFSLLVGIGFIAAFPSVGQSVLKFGWREAWSVVGWTLVAFAPIVWLLVRNNPEDVGLSVDGGGAPRSSSADLTIEEALSTPVFWLFALASSAFGLVYSGIALFNESILVERGFDASTYHTVLVISTMLGLVANFGGAWLATKWSIQKVMGCGMAVLAVALAALPLVRTFTHVVLYGIAMGIAGGVVTVVFFSVWGQVFGRTHLGRIQGCAQMMTVLASAVGPLLLAETLRRTGSYDLIFQSLAVIVVALGLGCWWAPLPVRGSLHVKAEACES